MEVFEYLNTVNRFFDTLGIVSRCSLQTLFSGSPEDSVSYLIISNEASKDAPGG